MKNCFNLTLVFGLIATSLVVQPTLAARTPYKISGADTSCGGFPRIPVATFSGSCLGQISKDEMAFPRKILELEPGRFLVTDMGGWDSHLGALWDLDLRGGTKKLTKRAKGLQTPHDIQFGPDGNVYVGERGRVTRFLKSDLLGTQPVQGQAVIEGLLKDYDVKNFRHPLMKFTFGKTENDLGDLYINIGSSSDYCEKEGPPTCKDGEKTGLIRRFYYERTTAMWKKDGVVFARGLRNSMGLVTHSSGTILQAENSRDLPANEEAFEEINVIEAGKHYGWPYCYNFAATTSHWKNIKCSAYAPPYLLLPPHVAPLDMLYYDGSMFPELQGHLLMSWHGYQPTGARVVAYPVNERGLPVLAASAEWNYQEYSPDGGVHSKPARPIGGLKRAAAYKELVSMWNQKSGVRPLGAPVGLTVASDGSILIVEDKNHSVLLLTRTQDRAYQETSGISAAEQVRIKEGVAQMTATDALRSNYHELYRSVFQPVCSACHNNLKGDEQAVLNALIANNWVIPGKAESPLLERVLSPDANLRMPKVGSITSEQQGLIRTWILGAGK